MKCEERKSIVVPEDCTQDATHEVRGNFRLSTNPKLRRKVIHLCGEHAKLWNDLNMGGLCGKPPAVPMRIK